MTNTELLLVSVIFGAFFLCLGGLMYVAIKPICDAMDEHEASAKGATTERADT